MYKKCILSITLLITLCQGLPTNHMHHFIESPKLSHWGEWGRLEHCPSDQVVVGMKLKVHDNQGLKDDTGLNAVKFYCKNPYSSQEYSEDVVSISSLVGGSGVWKKDFFCPRNSDSKVFAVGFQLRSESSSGVKDDTAGNNLKLICADLYQRQSFTVLEGDGTARGEWTKQQLCWPGYAICGLQTQVEITKSMDTTGLNNLKVRCCKVDSVVTKAAAQNDTSSLHPVESSSSSEDSSSDDSSSSSSGERFHPIHHAQNSDDEGGHEKGSEEALNTPDEQELIAFDPEPTEFSTSDDSSSNHTLPDNVSTTNIEQNEAITSSKEIEDDSLPEEIAKIEPVDNSEAHHEEDAPLTATYSPQQIPLDVVSALEDADIVDSKKLDDAKTSVLFDGSVDNNQLPADHQKTDMHQTEYARHESSGLGEIEVINTNTNNAVASKASTSQMFQQSAIGITLMVLFSHIL